jgi:hypothetical protein
MLTQLEQSRDIDQDKSALQYADRLWAVGERVAPLLRAVDDTVVWDILRELSHLDIANMTPVQALVILNELQHKLGDVDPAGI